MRKIVLILTLIAFSFIAKADHITGGEMFYTYIGNSGGTYSYNVTLKLFMRCNSGRQFPDPAVISIFEKGGTRIHDLNTPISSRETIQLTSFGPCITDPPVVCYEVAYYHFVVSVPASAEGYVVASQVNYRIRGISNLDGSQVGATYTCDIPGTAAADNNSAVFVGSDLVAVCANNYFTYSFAAADPDGDQIRYSFCSAYNSTNGGSNGTPSGNPPYPSVPYGNGFSSSGPLGGRVTIDPNTGLISGVAPPAGVYVVTVCAEEIRNGTVIGTQRKDLQINIADCNIAAATLEPDYMLCGTTRTCSVNNLSTSPLILSTDWDVFSQAGVNVFTSSSTTLTYTFPTNGVYTIRLIVNRGHDCTDTTTAPIYVFPGLLPDFNAVGICIGKPTVFIDRTTLISGSVNSWSWDFGESTTTNDVSTSQNNNVYTYPFTGPKDIRLIVTTTDGCRDTVIKTTEIIDKPPITFAFRDTLICITDQVQLQASGTGNFTWSPTTNMINANTPNPTVAPVVTTIYYADLETDGCKNRDSVTVAVVDHVDLSVMNDTLICRGDTIRLHIVSDGLHYTWTSAGQIIDPAVQNPSVITQASAPYHVLAVIGSCSANGNINVNTVPYPTAKAGADTLICYNTFAQLHAVTDGSSWQWTPASTLTDARSLTPVAHPVVPVTNYIFLSFDTRGCPKPGRDTVMVTMLPKIIPFAGHDTSVIVNQPLQLHASGGDHYVWSPNFGLSADNIADPVAIFGEPSNNVRYRIEVFNIAGCSEVTSLSIRVFATGPTVFVPTAFTPNNDGRNDVLRPIAVGMKVIEYFNIYNRWGQLIFTTRGDKGWDGMIAGQQQGNNTYVWMVKAIDYNDKPYFEKGTVTLIR
ncbi:MAG: T9SS type B sorting domain-containing protein [Chitinophagaceae bacterium]